MSNETEQMQNNINAEYFAFLEHLRESGATNMFGAGKYLQEEFGLDRNEAKLVLLSWIENHTKGKTNDKRIANAD
jgi:hypothetical protein